MVQVRTLKTVELYIEYAAYLDTFLSNENSVITENVQNIVSACTLSDFYPLTEKDISFIDENVEIIRNKIVSTTSMAPFRFDKWLSTYTKEHANQKG